MPYQHNVFRLTLIPSSSQSNYGFGISLTFWALRSLFDGLDALGVALRLVLNTHIQLNHLRGPNVLRYSKIILFVAIMAVASFLPSNVVAAGITISPAQTIAQGSQASYTVTVLPAGPAGQIYDLDVSGVAGSFTTNPVGPCGLLTCPATTLVVDAGTLPTYCPGTYSFTVHAKSTSTVDSGTGTGSVTVTQVGPPLQVTVSTNSPSYRNGQTITISVSATRPAEGVLQVTQPSGAPMTYPFAFTGATYGATKTLTASQPYGTYTVSVQADDYCGAAGFASTTFTVGPDTYDVSLSVSGILSQVSAGLMVDGQHGGTVGGSENKKLSFTIGSSHSIQVDQYVSGDTGVRYYCAENTWSVSDAGAHTFIYRTQYQFNVLADPSGVTPTTGGGWYNDGTTVQTNQAPQTVKGPSGTQYAFKNWELDGTAQSGNQLTVTMDKPHTAVAKYTTQYELVIDSPGMLGNPQGAGYYDAGSTATFSVTSPVGFLVQQVFVRWEGDYTGTSPQGSITMDNAKTVHAVWTTSYLQLYITVGVAAAAIIVGAFYMMRRRGPKSEKAAKPSKGRRLGLRMGKPKTES